ncbi:YafY family transcriptional regulator [Paenibacillus polymyxa]|jgi:predicted DNA-binding transcriptional regulator YafY|uniref:helix-turn-helix transcriptional regulator n=1 Tax=Paenibacillus polymyxa TaxID=1406 RepID=UPI00158041AD|nr:YafY family protein [Paenibacillus polymyxa]MBY0020948.1 YafY family transcriptional regulator [Paenibacillus polymyxa]MBY0057355.1 YafY family transcriptional regulator [Paenibacillus polymyxa]MBY0070793.1 YafY family transcriptional regulator [Paenibacillus polymyxa]MBY0082385.1 YafY family transcriptional regulator [Paenibacillus polymyxa]MBZ6441319.1 YafY family transcriptional regulator [Paenibacillus polymyxa]
MKKPERLNDMIRYLNSREYFNLNDLMDKYHISKSTALRDISSLEQLGMPIYSEHGRHGRYGILKNRLLSPIIFTMDEVYALYFAMLTLEAYQSTPFHLSVNKLNEKFEHCLSKIQINQIHKMKKVLQFEIYQHNHVSRYLDKILTSVLNETYCTIQYSKNNQNKSYHVQFFKISAKFGQWYATGIELNTNKYRVFRCDRITSIEEEEINSHFSIDELLIRSLEMYQSEKSIDFEVEIVEQAKDIFYKEHYPSMKIEQGHKTVIKGFYNPGEEEFIANYFMRYGHYVRSVKPESLKQIIKERVEHLLNHYQKL